MIGLIGIIDKKRLLIENSGNEVFFPQREVMWKGDYGIIVDGYIVITSIDDSITGSGATLNRLLQIYTKDGMKSLLDFLDKKIMGGSFNIAIVDKKKNELILVNDLFGFSPLYYSLDKTGFYFSSYMSPLIDLIDDRKLNFLYLTCFMHSPYVPGNITPFENIKILPPGSCLKHNIKNNKFELFCYDALVNSSTRDTKSTGFYGRKIFDALNNACRSLHSENLGYDLALSGGLDSRLVFGAWSVKESLRCISWGRSEDVLDIQIPHKLCEKFNVEHEILIAHSPSFEEFVDFLKRVDNPLEAYGVNQTRSFEPRQISMNGLYGEIMGGEYLWVIESPLKAFLNVVFPISKPLHERDINLVGKILYDSINRVSTDVSRALLNNSFYRSLKPEEDVIRYISSLLDKGCRYTQECIELFQMKQRVRRWSVQRNHQPTKSNKIVPMSNYDFVRWMRSVPIKDRFNFRFMYYFYRKFFPELCQTRSTKNKFLLDAPYQLQKFFMGWEQAKWRYVKPVMQKIIKKDFMPAVPEGMDYDLRTNEDLLAGIEERLMDATFINKQNFQVAVDDFRNHKKNLGLFLYKLMCLDVFLEKYNVEV